MKIFFIFTLILSFSIAALAASPKTARKTASMEHGSPFPYLFETSVSGDVAKSLFEALNSQPEFYEGNLIKTKGHLSCTKIPASRKKSESYGCNISLSLLDGDGTLEIRNP